MNFLIFREFSDFLWIYLDFFWIKKKKNQTKRHTKVAANEEEKFTCCHVVDYIFATWHTCVHVHVCG